MVSFFKFSFSCGESLSSRRKIWRLGNRQEVIKDRRKNSIWILWRFVCWIVLPLFFLYFNFFFFLFNFFFFLFCSISSYLYSCASNSLCISDRHHGVYLGEDVAVKVLKSDQLNDALEDEFTQEIAILRSVFCCSCLRIKTILHIAYFVFLINSFFRKIIKYFYSCLLYL